MNKNAIHNFNISIENSADIQSSEQLTQTMIKELAKVSKEINQQKDIEQLWNEYKEQNVVLNLSKSSTEKGAKDTTAAMFEKTAISEGTTFSVFGDNISTTNSGGISSMTTSISNALNGGDADHSDTSAGITSLFSRAEESLINFTSTTEQVYGAAGQQSLMVPQMFQTNIYDPSIEVIKAEIKKKLDFANEVKDVVGIEYWTRISKAFENRAVASDFIDKPGEILFTEMYTALKKSAPIVEIRNFDWEIVRPKMIKAIDDKILKGPISKENKKRWEIIRGQLADDKVDIANLFQHDELFLLLKEVEGLDILPGMISITTKTKVYPNLSPSRMYAPIGKENVYAFLKKIDEIDDKGRSVSKGAVRIKNTEALSFIVGESLEFFLDEKLITESSNKKEDINWIVYKDSKKLGADFINEGTTFSYNFDAPGAYIVEAFGSSPGANRKATSNKSAFVKFNVIAQEIKITAPVNVKDKFTRPFSEEKTFKVSLKNTTVQTLNPLKLYYQIETAINGKVAVISEERELDATGIIKLAMPDLAAYKIKVSSKDQYGLVKEFKTSVIKNEVTSIGCLNGSPKRNIFLVGNSGSKLTLEAKTYKIPPTEKEKQDVKWMIYDSNNRPYIQSWETITNENDDPKRPFILRWESFIVSIPQKEGHYTVEAYYDTKKGPKDGAVFKMEVKQPEIKEAYWASKDGSKKITSGFSGESNWIKANIPYYENQLVRIYFYLNNKKTNHYCDVKTNENGEILQEVKFDSNFKKLIGFPDNGTAKVGFKLLGIQNSNPYTFKKPANYEFSTILYVTTDKKVVDVYFRHDGSRLKSEDQVPFGKNGAMIAIAAKTQNMVGDEVTLKVHKVGEDPVYISKVRVDSEGVAAASFLMRNVDKKLKLGETVKYYAGVEGHSTKHLDNKVLVMIVGESKRKEKPEIIFPLLEKPINDTNEKWGENYNWTADDGRNQATFDSYRENRTRKHAARDLYTEPETEVIAIADGKVLETRYFYAGTDQVTVLHKLKDGRKFIARYGELKPNSVEVKAGDVIKQKTVIGKTGKLRGKSVITGQDIYMLHFEIFSAEEDESIGDPLTNTLNGSPFKRRKDLIDSIDILLEGYKNTFEVNKGTRKEVQMLSISEKGKQFIKDWELFKREMYDKDGDNNSKGNCTIGYGHLIHTGECDGSSSEEKFRDGISENEASKLFDKDILKFEKVVKNKIKVPLYQHEFDALVSYVYNIGQAFNAPNLIGHLNSKNYNLAVEDIETGSQNIKRRKQEKNMFSNGNYNSAH
ncbi:glycoside hydrolase family protein [Flavobacterium hungaricum]|uniref:Lysozyme n=1 Tax=Flavobacterium hungaricum TaxID=2082725 RepID=A0ABR9TKC8_9FLAO|nr:peptidoglycan DD-metalloendopeptidase family protein [Flavobacterium hungaricum]MBE8725823.1 hypothetical protein [Flavobacterium hungaricum]